MKQLTYLVGLTLLLLHLACHSEISENKLQTECSLPPSLGIFEQQNISTAPFRYDTLSHSFHLVASSDDALRFISKASTEDFILDIKIPTQSSSTSRFGLLLATDKAGEAPIAALQVMDGKLLFAPNTQSTTGNTIGVEADYIRLEYINGQAAAYYTIADDMRPIAIQQMDGEQTVYAGIFARSTAQDLIFESTTFSYPEIELPLSKK